METKPPIPGNNTALSKTGSNKSNNGDTNLDLAEEGKATINNNGQNTSLHLAILNNESIQTIQEIGFIDVNTENGDGLTPLHLAALQNRPDVIEAMLKADGIEINKKCKCHEKNSCLHYAVIGGSEEIVNLLLGRNVDISMTNSEGKSPLVIAVESKDYNSDIVFRLFEAGVKLKQEEILVKAFNIFCKCDGSKAAEHQNHLVMFDKVLDISLLGSVFNIAKTLLRKGATIHRETLSREIRDCGPVWDNPEMALALFKTAQKEKMEQIVLHSLADKTPPLENFVINKIFNLFCNCDENIGIKHIYHMCILNQRATEKKAYGYSTDENDDGSTVLEKYMLKGNLEMVGILAQKGAKPYTNTLHKIIKGDIQNANTYDSILANFPNIRNCINVLDRDGYTPLHLAAKLNRIDALEFILKIKEANINTFVGSADPKRTFEVITTEDNLNVSAPMGSGRIDVSYQASKAALDLAVKHGNREAVKLLLDNQARFYCGYNLSDLEWPLFHTAVNLCNGESVRTRIALMLFEANPLCISNALEYIEKKANNNDLMKAALQICCRTDDRKEHLDAFNYLLFTYVQKSDFELIEHLLQAGARPNLGVLHELIDQSVSNPQLIYQIKNVYHLIVKYSSDFQVDVKQMKNMKESMFEQLNETLEGERLKETQSVQKLNGTQEFRNLKETQEEQTSNEILEDKKLYETQESQELTVKKEDRKLNVLEYACSKGAVDMVEEILNTEGVFYFPNSKRKTRFSKSAVQNVCSKYDVTNLIPITMSTPPKSKISSTKVSTSPGKSLVEILIESSTTEESELSTAQLLDKEPFRSVTDYYFVVYRGFIFYLLLFHILYMSLFTWCLALTNETADYQLSHVFLNGTQNNCVDELWPDVNLNKVNRYTKGFCFLVWICWPMFIICFNLLEIIEAIIIFFSKISYPLTKHELFGMRWYMAFLNLPFVIIKCFIFIWKQFVEYFSNFFSLTFAVVAFSWLVLYFSQRCISFDLYLRLVAAVLIIGWMDTLNYLSVVAEPINNLIVMVKRIFAKDFVSFFFVYIFFYIGFAFSHNLFYLSQSAKGSDYDSTETFLAIFSIDNLAKMKTSIYNTDGGIDVVTASISIYCGITLLVLSNLLIAMVNQSYADINQFSRQQNQCLRLLLIRKSFWLSKLKLIIFQRRSRRRKHVHQKNKQVYIYDDDERYYMEINSDVSAGKSRIMADNENLNFKIDQAIYDIEQTNNKLGLLKTLIRERLPESTQRFKNNNWKNVSKKTLQILRLKVNQ